MLTSFEWVGNMLVGVTAPVATLLGAWLIYRQTMHKQSADAANADRVADDRAEQLMQEAWTRNQQQLVADFRADLNRTREERDAERQERRRMEELARRWSSIAHELRHKFNGLIHTLRWARGSGHEAVIPEPHPDLPPFDHPEERKA